MKTVKLRPTAPTAHIAVGQTFVVRVLTVCGLVIDRPVDLDDGQPLPICKHCQPVKEAKP